MQKKILVIILTVLVFISGSILGFATVFRVSDVVVRVSAISDEADIEAKELRTRLAKAYEKENLLFLNNKKAKIVVAEYPHFRIAEFKKDYPNRLVLTVIEDEELYAVKNADKEEYFILNADGTILAIRDNTLNRLDKKPNVVIDIEGLSVTGNKGEKLIGDERISTVLAFCNQMTKPLDGICDNIVIVKVTKNIPQYQIQMKEGVMIYVANPEECTLAKAEKIAEIYLNLSDQERLSGKIYCTNDGENVIANYQK